VNALKRHPKGSISGTLTANSAKSAQNAQAVHQADLGEEIDKAHSAKWSECYIEIIAKPAKKPVAAAKEKETK